MTTRCLIPLILIPVAFAASTRRNDGFITKLYQDLLHRSPSAVEMNLLNSILDAKNGQDGIAGVIVGNREYRNTEVNGYYQQYLGRIPSPEEANALIGLLFVGLSNEDGKAAILGSDEYFRRADGSVPKFLNQLYMDILGRPVDSAAAVGLAELLRTGATRRDVVLLVLRSTEARQVLVRSLYHQLLRRDPQAQEMAAMLPILQAGGQEVILIGLLCGSDEYFKR